MKRRDDFTPPRTLNRGVWRPWSLERVTGSAVAAGARFFRGEGQKLADIEVFDEVMAIQLEGRDEQLLMKNRTQRTIVTAAYGVLAMLLVAYLISLAVRNGSEQWTWLDGWLVCAFELVASLLCISRGFFTTTRRSVPIFLGTGLLMWTIGDIVLTVQSLGRANAPTLSVADAFYFLFYPLAYVACVTLFERALHRINQPNWLDGIVAGGGASALCAAFAFHSIHHFTGGSALATAVNLSFPIGDFLLLLFVFGGTAMLAMHGSRQWFLLASGFVVIVVGDTFNLVQTAGQNSVIATDINAFAWPLAILLMSLSVWVPARFTNPMKRPRLHGFILMGISSTASLGVLVRGTLTQTSHVAIGLAVGTILVLVARLTISARRLRLITEERHLQANTDELTGLGNRRRLTEILELFFIEQKENPRNPRNMAFLFVDLNHFKEVNDSYGHPAGDELLRQLGPRISAAVDGAGVAARMGGDEFAIILMDADAARAESVSRRLIEEISKPFTLNKINARVGASVGIALVPTDANNALDVMWCADVAMYRAKLGNVPILFYEQKFDGDEDQMTLIDSLRVAVTDGTLILHYQPQLDLRTGEIVAVEALIRWPHPNLGLIPPMKFLPLAEKAGLMWTLTTWVMKEAISQCAQWHREGKKIAVSINVATTELLQFGFVDHVKELLTFFGLPAQYFVVEITETTIVSDFERSQEVISQLRDMGVLVSIDDFGAGFTSLTYLQNLDVGELKLDRTFISSLASSENDRNLEIVRATINLGHEMGLRVVAEGIEDIGTLEILSGLGCDLAQGYYISRPAPPEKIRFQTTANEAAEELAKSLVGL
jgi:diguanylate cyclase (GGDEF)-like protein